MVARSGWVEESIELEEKGQRLDERGLLSAI